MRGKYTITTLLALIAVNQVASLSLILQSMDPYCFLVDSKRGNEIKVSYMVSGLNEEQVEFKVRREKDS